MLCKCFEATMSTDACLRRQKWAEKYKKDITVENNVKVKDHSLLNCLDCNQGKAVNKNPKKFINRDFLVLKERQIQLIRKRGWVFKESISYESLFDNFDYTMIDVNSERRNHNGKREGILKKSTRERIIRFVRKHRNSTRSKQNVLSSNRLELKIRKRF